MTNDPGYRAALRSLPDAELERAAAYHRELVSFLEAEQARRQARIDRAAEAEERIRSAAELARAIRDYVAGEVAAGAARADALRRACGAFQVSEQSGRLALQRGEQMARQAQRAARDRTILQLARRGLSDKQIARRAGCSPATVSRTIKTHGRDQIAGQ